MLPMHTVESQGVLVARRHRLKAVTKRPLPAGASAECIAPAAFRPIGRPFTDGTGISFPVIFCPVLGRAVAKQKDGILKLPAIPEAAFPAVGKALPRSMERSIKASLFFCSGDEFNSPAARSARDAAGRQSCNGGKPIE